MFLIGTTPLYIKAIGIIGLALGIPLYVFFSPKIDIHHLKAQFLSEEAILMRQLQRTDRFLAYFIERLHRGYQKIRFKKEKQ
jgi:APA family basic amino acid/polyamine antiporter